MCEKFAHRNTALRGIAIRASNFRFLRRRVRIVFGTLPKRQLDRAMSIEKARESVYAKITSIFSFRDYESWRARELIINIVIPVSRDHTKRNNAVHAPATVSARSDIFIHFRPLRSLSIDGAWNEFGAAPLSYAPAIERSIFLLAGQ